MRGRVLAGACCILWAGVIFAQTTATAPARLAIPGAAARTRARDMIHTVLKADFAKTAAADRQQLAKRLLSEAHATKDDPDARYVLLTESADLAATVGDAATALAAIDEAARLYAIDALDQKRAALLKTAAADLTPELAEPLSRLALETAAVAAEIDRYDIVTPLLNLAEAAAHKTRKIAFVASIQVRLADLRALAADFPKVKEALARLEIDPQNADAHQLVGCFYAFQKGQWPIALPHLAAGSDKTLRELAARELANPADGLEQAALGDAWWDYSSKVAFRARIAEHAREWYRRGKNSITGITLARIESRLQESTTPPAGLLTIPPQLSNHATLNLLALIDTAKDKADGDWTLENGALLVAEGRYSTLQLPASTPEEFDLRITFTRTDGTGPIAILLATRNRNFDFALDVRGEARFERVNNKISKDNPTAVPVTILNNRKYSLAIQVRSDGLKALLDDKLLTHWKGDYKELSRYNWKLPNEKLSGIGANNAKVIFHSIDLVPINGAAKPLR